MVSTKLATWRELDQKCMFIDTPLPPFQEGAVQSVRVRQEEQRGEPQGGDQGKDLAEDIKLFQNDPEVLKFF